MKNNKGEALINDLTEGLTPQKPMRPPAIRAAAWLLPSIVYMLAVMLVIGVRTNAADKLSDPAFLLEILSMSLISISATMASIWLCIPDMRGAKWLIPLPLFILSCFILWTALRGLTEGLEPLGHFHWKHCIEEGILMAFIPAAALVFAMRRGATTRPHLSALMNILAVGSLSYVGLRFTCPNDTILHVTIYHVLPFALLGAMAGMLARKLYKW